MELLTDLGKAGYERGIGPGVYDIHSPRVPTVDEIEEALRLALAEVDADRLWVNPDCGLKTRGYTEVEPALRNMVGRDTQATEGLAGVIPGSMGTASYVVAGKGNRASLNSSPHGAGRNYSRSKARRTFTRDELRTAMAGIEYRDSEAFLDEIPLAYKDIDVVMADAADLVGITHTLHQIVNVKGD
jgi:RNA-splicing ligase RtcB